MLEICSFDQKGNIMSKKKRTDRSTEERDKEAIDEIKSILPPELLSVDQNISPEDLKKKFPNLHAEITENAMGMKIDDVEGGFSISEEENPSSESTDLFSNFEPSTIDFIRRAKTDSEAEEIITFSLKQGHISSEEADKLIDQLKKRGVRSFGPIRTNGHYFRKATEERNRKLIKKRYSIPK